MSCMASFSHHHVHDSNRLNHGGSRPPAVIAANRAFEMDVSLPYLSPLDPHHVIPAHTTPRLGSGSVSSQAIGQGVDDDRGRLGQVVQVRSGSTLLAKS